MNSSVPRRVLILGAAGRDFHNFNIFFRNNPNYQVVGFTAAQIPDIDNRLYPPSLAGPLYPQGIPIWNEDDLESLILAHKIDEVVFAYSDISYQSLMSKSARAMSSGASFRLLGPNDTMLSTQKPVIAVTAVRTGCGKSQTTRRVANILTKLGKKVVVVRHPMPYGDLNRQKVQRFTSLADLTANQCTIEEMEEYE
ncbi:MAG: GTPase, partial [bacterium]